MQFSAFFSSLLMRKLILSQTSQRLQILFRRLYSTEAGQPPPELPTTCCMSGCANCVWLDYAEDMVKYYQKRGDKVPKDKILQEINSHLSDPMVKAFVLLELKFKL